MEPEIVQVDFDVGGKIITANVPAELLIRLYEDEVFRTEYANNLIPPEAEAQEWPQIHPVQDDKEEEDIRNGHELRWQDASIKLLLTSYADEKENFRNPKIKKKSLWAKINTVMQKYGHRTTVDSCDKKFRNLKATYTSVKDRMKKTGRGRQKWNYYDLMETIMQGDDTINPPFLISSLKVSGNNPRVECRESVPSTPKESVPAVAQLTDES